MSAAATVRALLPSQVATAVLDPRTPQPALMEVEQRATARMVPQRRREFAAGRAAARQAMAGIGITGQPVPAGPDRAPCWPRGATGSIAHCADCCVAIAGASTQWRMLGVDIEPDIALPPDLIDTICGEAELRWLAAQPASARGRLARAIFSAKECAYKAQYPLTGRLLGFEDVRVTLDPAAGRFAAAFATAVDPFAADDTLQGGLAMAGGHILTALALPR